MTGGDNMNGPGGRRLSAADGGYAGLSAADQAVLAASGGFEGMHFYDSDPTHKMDDTGLGPLRLALTGTNNPPKHNESHGEFPSDHVALLQVIAIAAPASVGAGPFERMAGGLQSNKNTFCLHPPAAGEPRVSEQAARSFGGETWRLL